MAIQATKMTGANGPSPRLHPVGFGTVWLDETDDGGKPLALQFQVFAYEGDERFAVSDLWAVEVAK